MFLEDRTEQVRLASARDTLLRVRAATFDNLLEAISVFASDGRLYTMYRAGDREVVVAMEAATGNGAAGSRTSVAASAMEALTVKRIGEVLMTDYVWPLQCVGLLLTAALIGALVLVMEEKR